MYTRYSTSCARHALTLIEVVTALALLSTLLVGILVAFRKNAERMRAELQVRTVVAGVDQLLLSWAEQGTYVPLRGSGALPGLDGFTWQTHLVSRASRSALGVEIVRFEVRAERAPDAGGPILAIELPVPASVDTGAEREAR